MVPNDLNRYKEDIRHNFGGLLTIWAKFGTFTTHTRRTGNLPVAF
jgi:hypothetical protein